MNEIHIGQPIKLYGKIWQVFSKSKRDVILKSPEGEFKKVGLQRLNKWKKK